MRTRMSKCPLTQFRHYGGVVNGWCLIVAVITLTLISSAATSVHADLCDKARDLAQKYIDSCESFRVLAVNEEKQLVDDICHADDEDREPVANDGGARLEDRIDSEVSKLGSLKQDATDKLSAALKSDHCKDKASNLKEVQDNLQTISERIDRLSSSIRAGDNPVISKLRELGQIARKDYYTANSDCSKFNEYTLSNGQRPDCLDPDKCEVVELKPDSSAAISKGRESARKARDALNTSPELERLVDKYPVFVKCEKFRARVDCYVYCPELDHEGQIKSTSIGWTTCDHD